MDFGHCFFRFLHFTNIYIYIYLLMKAFAETFNECVFLENLYIYIDIQRQNTSGKRFGQSLHHYVSVCISIYIYIYLLIRMICVCWPHCHCYFIIVCIIRLFLFTTYSPFSWKARETQCHRCWKVWGFIYDLSVWIYILSYLPVLHKGKVD